VPVPPLLLQPLVENAIKHGLEPHVQGGLITWRRSAKGPNLLLSVRDTAKAWGQHRPTRQARAVLAQVRQRLSTLYGQAAADAAKRAR
jgi:LytS/YehU family sensor histidine kinase